MYFVLVVGASREEVSTWRQDLLATAVFLVFLATGFTVRTFFTG
jgi:hypothetical protein